jgi:transposase
MESMARDKYSPELKERAVRMVLDHLEKYNSQWQAINSIAEKIGCPGRRFGSGSAMRKPGVRVHLGI